jgi:hypothetical protein
MHKHKRDLTEAMERRADLLTAEQFCTDCKRWTPVPVEEVRAMLDECAAPRTSGGPVGVRMRFFDCAHCSARQTVLQPGKYDRLRAQRYTMQRYGFR